MRVIWGVIILSGLFVFSSGCKKTSENTISNPTTSAIRFYGNEYGNLLYSFGQTPDGGYYFGGSTNSSAADAGQGFIQKTDKNGNVLWYQNYGGPLQDLFAAVHSTTDGGFIAAGGTNSFGFGASRQDFYGDGYLVKTGPNGNIVWQNPYGDIYPDLFYDVAETPDHGYVAVGRTYSINNYTTIYVVKTDQNGKKLWSKEFFQGFFYSAGTSVCVAPNGDIAVLGAVVKSAFAVDQGTNYPVFILLNAAGRPINHTTGVNPIPYPEYKTWGGLVPIYNNTFRSEKIISYGKGFIIAANIDTPFNLLKVFNIDTMGNMLWNKQFTGLSTASCNDIIVDNKSNLLISGVTVDTKFKNYAWLLNLDPNGNKLWETDIPVQGYNAYAAGVAQTANNYSIGASLSSTHLNIPNIFGFFTVNQNGNLVENK